MDVVSIIKRQRIAQDEIHTIVGAGGTGDGGGAIDAGNIMKPALSRGELQAASRSRASSMCQVVVRISQPLQVIGATTIEEYRKYIEKDKVGFWLMEALGDMASSTCNVIKCVPYKKDNKRHPLIST